MSKRITIKDIARETGFSVATVSRVINNTGCFYSESTKKSIQEAVASLGYTPNMTARGLRENKSYTIALLIPELDDYYTMIYNSVFKEARKNGYIVSVLSSNYDCKEELSNISLITENNYDGVIVATGFLNDFTTEQIRTMLGEMPMILVESSGVLKNVSSVNVDVYALCKQSTCHLIQNGHRRIAYVSAPMRFEGLEKRYNGYLDALRENMIEVDEDIVFFSKELEKVDYDGSYSLMNEILDQSDFTAMLVMSDWAAFTAIKAAKKLGKRIPQDLSIIGFDNLPFTNYIDPPLTTVYQNGEQIGKCSMELLIELFNGGDGRNIQLPGEIIFRGSTSVVN